MHSPRFKYTPTVLGRNSSTETAVVSYLWEPLKYYIKYLWDTEHFRILSSLIQDIKDYWFYLWHGWWINFESLHLFENSIIIYNLKRMQIKEWPTIHANMLKDCKIKTFSLLVYQQKWMPKQYSRSINYFPITWCIHNFLPKKSFYIHQPF